VNLVHLAVSQHGSEPSVVTKCREFIAEMSENSFRKQQSAKVFG